MRQSSDDRLAMCEWYEWARVGHSGTLLGCATVDRVFNWWDKRCRNERRALFKLELRAVANLFIWEPVVLENIEEKCSTGGQYLIRLTSESRLCVHFIVEHYSNRESQQFVIDCINSHIFLHILSQYRIVWTGHAQCPLMVKPYGAENFGQTSMETLCTIPCGRVSSND